MRTIAICNLKGGVAKTTTVINVAAILAREHGQRVLVVDADSQCNTTEFFQHSDEHWRTLSDVLRYCNETGDMLQCCSKDGAEYAAAAIMPSRFGGVDILPADDSLMDLDLTKVEQDSANAGILRAMMAELASHDIYDWVLVDCPPAFNAASTAALLAVDEVLIPIKLDAFSLRGMTNLLRQISNMREINPSLRLAGLLPTMWYRSPNIEEAEETLRASGLHIYRHIRRTNKVDDMTFAQEPLLISSPKSAAGVDYRGFVAELISGSKEAE